MGKKGLRPALLPGNLAIKRVLPMFKQGLNTSLVAGLGFRVYLVAELLSPQKVVNFQFSSGY